MRFADKTTIYIPLHLQHKFGVGYWCDVITRAVGGATHEEVRGVWKNGGVERILRVSWWHAAQEPAMIHVTTIARALIEDHGEEAVLVEYLRSQSFHHARLLTRDDVVESDDE